MTVTFWLLHHNWKEKKTKYTGNELRERERERERPKVNQVLLTFYVTIPAETFLIWRLSNYVNSNLEGIELKILILSLFFISWTRKRSWFSCSVSFPGPQSFPSFTPMTEWLQGKCPLLPLLTLYTLTSVCIFSILFSIHFQRGWRGEFVSQSRAA